MKPILEVKNLSVCFGPECIIEDVSFTVEEGDYLMILGPNGAGKSVLVKAILGVLPYHGQVIVWGQDVKKSYGKIGYVPQYLSADRFLPINVSEMVGLGLPHTKRNKIDEVIEVVGLKGKGQLPLMALSGGQLKRVLIAQALLKKPAILIMDEPFAGVDIVGEESVTRLLDDLRVKMKLTMIVISHDISLVYKSATKVLCINKVRTCFGMPSDIHHKQIEQTFGKGLKVHVKDKSDV